MQDRAHRLRARANDIGFLRRIGRAQLVHYLILDYLTKDRPHPVYHAAYHLQRIVCTHPLYKMNIAKN
jgi:hypothetical protein